MNHIKDIAHKPRSVLLSFTTSLVVCSLCLSVGIFAERHFAKLQWQAWADSSAALVAARATEKWLSDDRLSLQIVTRTATKQKQLHHVGIYDNSGTPLAEHGHRPSEPALQGRASIRTGNSTVGYVLVTPIAATNSETWLALLLAPLLAAISAAVTALRNRRRQRKQQGNTPFGGECLLIAASKKPAPDATYHILKRALPKIADYYDAKLHQGPGYVMMSFSDKNATGRAIATARLWYGFYYALQRKHKLGIDAAVYACSTPKTLVDEAAENDWLFKTLYTAQHVEGVMLENSFAEQKIATEIATLSKRPQGYFLKQLCKEEEAIVLKQLNDLLKTYA